METDSDYAYFLRRFAERERRDNVSDESTRDCRNVNNIEPSKRRKNSRQSRTKEKPFDRISNLPDSLLLHILSFLSIADAVKTGILSKRWAYLWTYSPRLIYHHVNPWSGHKDFVDSVNQTLVLHDCSKIKKFAVDFGFKPEFHSHVDLWVRFATRKNAEELHLDFYDGEDDMDPLDYPTPDHYLLPQHLFANSSLTKLSLKFCDLAPPMSVCWPSLKGLSIGQTKLSDDVIRTILLGSPALECLKLKGCEGFNHIDITSQNLRKFAIDGFEDSTGGFDVSVLEISGPHLRSLHITGNLHGRKCRLRNVPRLVDVILSFEMAVEDEDHENLYENQREILRELLEVLRHVKEFTIGTWCIQVLSLRDVKNLPSPLSTRKCLILNTWLPKWDIPGIASLLESSPDLEKIVINRIASDYLEFDRDLNFSILYNFDEKKYWISQKRIFKCLLFHLKTVEISGAMTAPGRMCERVTSITQFLLKNARVLEKMVIYKQEYNRRWMGSGSRSQNVLKVAEKLLSFPRSSPDAVILFRN